MEDLFEVVDVSQISMHTWLVRGRAWRTFKQGDTIYTAVGRYYSYLREGDKITSTPIDVANPQRYPFTVEAISTYRREIDTMYAGLTGDIILQGDHGEALKETKILVGVSS